MRAAPVLLFVLGTLIAAIWALGLPPGAGTTGFAWRAVVLGALAGAAAAIAWRRTDRSTLWLILAFGLVFRLAAWTWPPDLSSDLYRYVWDGRVQVADENPYRAAPSAPSLTHLRDTAVWPRINRPDAVTVYPPGAQLAFLALARLGGDSVAGVKTAALAVDLVVLGLLVFVLRRRGLPCGRLILYAWSPLVVAETCVSGHVDVLVLVPVLVALIQAERDRPATAGAFIGLAALVKLYPLLLLAALPHRRARATAAALVVVAAGYLFYADAGRGVLGFLPEYVRSGEDFNSGLRTFLEWVLNSLTPHAHTVAAGLCLATLALVAGKVAIRRAKDPFPAAAALITAFLVTMPTPVHPWYALWLAPLLLFAPLPAGLWLVAVLPLSYLKYGTLGDVMPPWVLVVEWLPAFALVAWSSRRRAI